jgi:hypothetical protein
VEYEGDIIDVGYYYSKADQYVLRRWNPRTGDTLFCRDIIVCDFVMSCGLYNDIVICCGRTFTPTKVYDGSIALYSAQDGKEVRRVNLPGMSGLGLDRRFSPPVGRVLLSGYKERFGGVTIILDPLTGNMKSLPDTQSYFHPGTLSGSDQSLFAVVESVHESDREKVLRIIDLPNGERKSLLERARTPGLTISDMKLLPGDRELALATQDGTFLVLDPETGHQLRRRTGMRYAPSRALWYVLGGLSTFWCVAWWKATRRSKDQPLDLGRYPSLVVFLGGLIVGLLLMFCRDQYLQIYTPNLAIALSLACLSAVTGFVLLFIRNCNTLASGYTLLSSALMAAYIGYLMVTLT